MPISYEIDTTQGLVLTTASGTLTDDDIIRHKRALAADSRYRPGMKELSDVRAVTDLRVTPEGIQAMVVEDVTAGETFRGHRLAIVAPEDEAFGMARMYQMFSEAHAQHVGVFRTLDDARRWRGVGESGPRG